tara:strand:- start:425 stop:1429 length:1005 start_codon:yes stop_codon:yes gene_type:complete
MKIEKIKINKLKPAEYNPRQITKSQFNQLKDSIAKFGLVDPIIINQNGNIVVGGHQRLKAMQQLNHKEIECVVLDLTPEEEKELNIRLNKNGGEWDFDLLSNFDIEELKDWGFKEIELGLNIDKITEGNTEDDHIPEVKESRVKLGDVWQLGNHRLMCGDSTKESDVEKLMNGDKADMVFTDPPYGISIVDKNTNKVGAGNLAKNQEYSQVIGDDTTETAKNFYNTCVSLGMENFIIWGGNYFVDFLPFSSSWIVWDKRGEMNSNNFADGEMAWCSFHTRVRIYKQIWNGMIREGESGKRVHPTQKPLRTLSEIIKDHIKGDIIYDGFLVVVQH